MRYSKYPSYRDSGVEWLGDIPSEWETKKLKFISTVNDDILPNSTSEDEEINYIDIGSVTTGYIQNHEQMLYANAPSRAKRIIKNGDILVSTVRTYLKAIAPVPSEYDNYIASTGFAVIRSSIELNSSFTKYALLSNYFVDLVESRSVGVSYPAINASDIMTFNIALPPVIEQQTIANYLDISTAKIDTLIEKQTRLIELLKEKRQAVISTAVTHGLDSTVAMKDSGVEWLGEIPDAWGVTPLRYIGRLQNGISKGADYFGSGFPFVNYGDIYNNASLPSHVEGLAKSSKSDQHVYSVQKGDIFFTRTSETIDDIGMASTCLHAIENATFSGFTIRFRQLKQILNENFSKYYFRTGHSQAFFKEQLNLVTRASLGQDILKQLPVLLPSMKEQRDIAIYLDNKTSKIDTLIYKATKAIDLLKEKRTALISSVVTGKIDVREIA